MNKRKLIVLILILACISISLGVFVAVFRKDSGEEFDYVSNPDIIDTDIYYRENAEVIKEISVMKSKDIKKEEEVYEDLVSRGFDQQAIITEYDIEGNYLDETEISEESKEKHPMYQTSYINEHGDVWTIMVINDSIAAFPVTYYLDKGISTEVILSEKDTVTCYDEYRNKFYEIIPGAEMAIVKHIDTINAETLNMLTNEAIDRL